MGTFENFWKLWGTLESFENFGKLMKLLRPLGNFGELGGTVANFGLELWVEWNFPVPTPKFQPEVPKRSQKVPKNPKFPKVLLPPLQTN